MKIKPWLEPGEPVAHLGRAFGTPLLARQRTWLPLAPLFAWGLLTWLAGRRHPAWSFSRRLVVGAASAAVVVGSEWGHNLAHTAAARLVGRPVDAIRVTWGMPLLVYHQPDDPQVTPRQHLIRTLAGPLFNLLLLPLFWLLRRSTPPASPAQDIFSAGLFTNQFISLTAFTPLPYLDGGPLLRWYLVERGRTLEQADAALRAVSLAAAGLYTLATAFLLRCKRWLPAALSGQFAFWCAAYGWGWIESPPQAFGQE